MIKPNDKKRCSTIVLKLSNSTHTTQQTKNRWTSF